MLFIVKKEKSVVFGWYGYMLRCIDMGEKERDIGVNKNGRKKKV